MPFARVPVLLAMLSLTTIAASCARDEAPEAAASPSTEGADMMNEASALDADREWMAALERGDAAAAGDRLDSDFEWTNTEGWIRTRDEAILSAAQLADSLRGETDVQTYHYGHVEVITSARPGERVMRVWALRPDGWRALAVIGTALAAGTTPFAATGLTVVGDCENPCRSMPYAAITDNERAIADIFMQLKMDEWHPNPERWAPYVLDDVYYTTATARLSKAARVEHLTTLREANAPSVPGDPVVSMRIVDFGDSAVMIARHNPYRGGQPYHSVRVWAFRDGRWQLANTQQTAIADAPAAQPVAVI